MEKIVLRIFQKEIERQCNFAITAAEQIETGLGTNNLNLVWYAIQSFLVAAGNVSKILWPSNLAYQNRGEELRKSLGIGDDSVIHPRAFRNHFEHFDERLESWAEASKRHNFVDSNIGPHNMIAGIDKDDFLRNFDNTTWELTFRGDKYNLKEVRKAISELYQKVSTEANKPWWDEISPSPNSR